MDKQIQDFISSIAPSLHPYQRKILEEVLSNKCYCTIPVTMRKADGLAFAKAMIKVYHALFKE